MLVIRKDQVAILRQYAAARFADTLVKHLMTNYPGPSATIGNENDVAAFVDRGMERAAALGIDSADAITAMLELWAQFGEHFERSPLRQWTLKMLNHAILPGNLKGEAIRERHSELTDGRTVLAF